MHSLISVFTSFAGKHTSSVLVDANAGDKDGNLDLVTQKCARHANRNLNKGMDALNDSRPLKSLGYYNERVLVTSLL